MAGFLLQQVISFPANFRCLGAIALSFFMMLPACTYISAASDSAVMKNATDHFSLLAFKKEVTLDPAKVLSSWNDSFHFCFWRGVFCGRKHQRVTILSLPSSGLVGTLTPHLGNLTFLRWIDLTNNSFRGEIPQEVGRLFRLRHLVLMNNSIEGEIPSNLSNCPHLVTINVANNKLHGTIPAELGYLQSLDYLNLQFNRLSGVIPPTLGNLSSLTILALVECNLEGPIPHQLGQLSKLEYLGIFENQLTGKVPHSIYNNLSNIRSFQIGANNLTGNLPSHVGTAFTRLEFFSVALNRLTGTIPRSLFNASHLSMVDVGDNNFVGSIPVEVGKLGSSLSRFHAGDNQLGGDLQFITSLTNCTNLYGFAAYANSLHGLLPNSLVNLSANTLEVIALGRNRIYGTIHPELGKLYNLRQLSLSDNLLKGSLPPSIGMITNLEVLSLENNRLDGRIPGSLANLTLLVQLNLATNLLQGNIQQILAICSNLEALILSDNQLEGSIPPILAKCANLRTLHLDNNRLTGTIPSDLFSPTSLVVLNLSHNSLEGELPQEIGRLINVKTVSIGRNNLSGSIPEQIGNCLVLELLLMDGNAFEGAIPVSLKELRALRKVDLSRNKLEGLLPRYFVELKGLEYLNLSFNDLKGEVPREGIFKNVTAISLEGNIKLCGGISELHLPPCTKGTAGQGKHKSAKIVKVVLLVVGGSMLVLVLVIVALCLILFFRKKSFKNRALPRLSFNDMKVISYRNLLNATNRFSPSNLIGTGSFGFVYKGVLNDDQTVVAVKVFNLEQVGASESFMSECEALQNIRHRNLVKILTCCSGQDYRGREFKALVYEFMENGTLESWLHPGNGPSNGHSRRLSLRARLGVAIDVAHALDYLHNNCHNPIVHCDLKPTNILFDEDMVAHVTDFGLARILLTANDGSSSLLVCTDKLKGTAGYIPPEYGTNSYVTTQGDVFSYGVLLLEMLIGKKPTHEMFKEDLTISNYAKMAFPNQIVDIVDPVLFPHALGQDVLLRRIGDCIVSILKIGIECSSDIPSNRTDMGIVKNKLERVREQLPCEEL